MELIAEAVELARNATHLGDHDQAWQLVKKAAEAPENASELGFTMARSLDAAERKIGFDLLGCLVHTDESLPDRVLSAGLDLIASETDHSVLAAIARALGCTGDERAVPGLLRMADHPDEDVRFYVAWSLPMGCEGNDAVIEALIRLSADPEDEVRNWATFALGSQCQADSTAIRGALWARLDDQYTEAREEAIAGLARRRDRRVIPHVERILERGGVGGTMFTAVACLGDPALVPYLEDYAGDDVAEALRECDSEARAARDAFAADLTRALHSRMPGLDFGVYGEICEPGLTLSARENTYHWSVEPLLDRAGGDPLRAADLVAGHLS
ncbi:HEAT repeat domain-containing protein [Nonomuraea sp. NPDC050394]|uniref:HEAT repeat domain-containing protein n=1 Tax=Nonomuraea sp. NPDC050394 TaxID=3364363 RepID=UPI0037A4E185